MKHKLILFLTTLCFTLRGFAQEVHSEITSVMQNDNTVEFSISSNKVFYTGDNLYILHVGTEEFKLSKQYKTDAGGIITFLIPLEDFNALAEAAFIWMSYGEKIKNGNEAEIEKLSKEYPGIFYSLGKFRKDMLNK